MDYANRTFTDLHTVRNPVTHEVTPNTTPTMVSGSTAAYGGDQIPDPDHEDQIDGSPVRIQSGILSSFPALPVCCLALLTSHHSVV